MAKAGRPKGFTISGAAKELEELRAKMAETREQLKQQSRREEVLSNWLAMKLAVRVEKKLASVESVLGSRPKLNLGKGTPRKGSQRQDILEYIGKHDLCRAGEIAEALGIKPNNVNQAAFNLRKAGKLKSLTKEGKEPGKGENGGYLRLA